MSRDRKDKHQYLSYSGYMKYLECPRAYYLEYVERDRPAVEDSRNTLNGNALHKLLEEWLSSGDPDPKWMLRNGARIWKEHMDSCKFIDWRSPTDKKELLLKYEGWVHELIKLVAQANINPESCTPEINATTNVKLPSGGMFRMGGKIDVFKEKKNGDVLFFDLKASETRGIMKLEQILWYGTLLSAYLDNDEQPQYGGYILPGFKELKLYKIPKEAKLRLLADVDRVVQAIQNKEFDADPDKSKYWFCPVKHRCCSAPVPNQEFETGIIDLGAL